MKPIRLAFRWFALAAMLMATAKLSAADRKSEKLSWGGLQPNLTPQQVAEILEPKLGHPLIVTKARGGAYETWNYDNGGSVSFVHGLLDYWTAPRTAQPTDAPSAGHDVTVKAPSKAELKSA